MKIEPGGATPRTAGAGPSGRAIVGWGLVSLVFLGVVVPAGYLAHSVWTTNHSLEALGRDGCDALQGWFPRDATGRLGGARTAASRLSLYCSLPNWAAPRKLEAAGQLYHCRPHGVRALARLLTHTDSDVRCGAANALRCWETDAVGAQAELLECMRHENGTAQLYAALALLGVGQISDEIRRVLEARASGSDLNNMALSSLGWYFPDHPGTRRVVIAAFRNPNRVVRWDALRLASRNRWRDQATIDALAAALDDAAASYGVVCERSMWGPADVKQMCAILEEIGPPAAKAAGGLRKLSCLRGQEVQAAAATALWRVEGRADEVVEQLLAGLEAEENPMRNTWEWPRSRISILKALARMETDARQAEPALRKLAADGTASPRFREELAHTIRAVSGEPPVPAPAWEVEFRRRLQERISVDLIQGRSNECFELLGKTAGVPVQIEPAVRLSGDKPITLAAQHATVEEILAEMVAIASLNSELREEGIYIHCP